MTDSDTKTSDSIPTNLRLLRLLEAMAEVGVPVTPTAMIKPLGLPKPTVHRLFATLEKHQYIQRHMGGAGYVLAQRVRILSANVLSSQAVRTARNAILTRLAEEIGETCNIALPDGDAMTYIERAETKWPLRIQLPIGSRVPLYCTASGKLYLSSLSTRQLNAYLASTELQAHTPSTNSSVESLTNEIKKISKQGFSCDSEEFMVGMIAVGVPIMDSRGRLLSTLSFHAPIQRLPMQEAVKYVEKLNQAAEQLQQLIV